jgi:hypothetical protein
MGNRCGMREEAAEKLASRIEEAKALLERTFLVQALKRGSTQDRVFPL